MQVIDIVGDPAIIARVVELAEAEGHRASQPMSTQSVSDALDAPIGVEEVRQVCEVVTVMMGTGTSVVGFLAAVKMLLGKSETKSGEKPKVTVKRTKDQSLIGEIDSGTDIATLSG
jgi:hypothetical protein